MPAQSGPQSPSFLLAQYAQFSVWIPLTIFGTNFDGIAIKTISMRTFVTALFSVLLSVTLLTAQTDATALLDKHNKKTKGYSSLEAAFTFSVINPSQKVNEVRKGTIAPREGVRWTDYYEKCLAGSTYLKV